MSETITIIQRLAEARGGDLGADFRAGLSVSVAEAERVNPSCLSPFRPVHGERTLAGMTRRAGRLKS